MDIAEIERQNKQLKRLVELSVTLNSMLELDGLLRLITSTATELLDCESASILLFDEKHPRLYFAAATGSDPQKLAEIPVPMEGSLAGTIFRTNQPMLLNNVQQDPRHYALVSDHIQFKVRNLLGVPMRIKDRTIGVLEAVNKKDNIFTAHDETILSVTASHAAIAINNARLLRTTREALEKVKEAGQLKSNFLTRASHELRTPLGIIIGYASFLREDGKEQVSSEAQHVLDAAMRLRTLVEDMTNLTMLETKGLMLIRSREVSIQNILRSACSEINGIAAVKEQKVVFAFGDEPLMVNADPEKLAIAFINLLNNAVRFSPQGGEITVGAAHQDGDVLAWVQDRGIGIAADKLESIFNEFNQAESPNTRRYGGLGLGLAIASGLVEAQEGKIWAESGGPDKGSTFKVLLPLA